MRENQQICPLATTLGSNSGPRPETPSKRGIRVTVTLAWCRSALWCRIAGAVGEDGIGLSGIGYGLFGLLWVLSREHNRFLDAIDGQTSGLFVGWFFFCIMLTWTGVWRVGNVAHGAGAVLGLGTGLAIARPAWRVLCASAVASMILLATVTGFLWRPYLDWNQEPGRDFAILGSEAIQDGQPKDAVELLQQALEMNSRQAEWWYNPSAAYARLGQSSDAAKALRHALEIKPGQADWRRYLAQFTARTAYEQAIKGDHAGAVRCYRESLDLDENNANTWYNLAISHQHLGNLEESRNSYKRAAQLEPDNPTYQDK
jgi:cytochrome c-type biogenesis protein CcmH/NrfG